jgi:S-formylglutathione hydrolase FrmB
MKIVAWRWPSRTRSFRFLAAAVAVVAGARLPTHAGTPPTVEDHGTTEVTVTFRSESLSTSSQYMAILPDPLEPGRRYPVLYLLHGADGSHRTYTMRTSVTQEMQKHSFMVVMPDGGKDGWYLDSDRIPHHCYESLIIKDVIPDVDRRFPTLASRSGRGIAGFSMGGHGALSLAAKHPELFMAASSISGTLRLENHTTWKVFHKLMGPYPAAAKEWQSHSVCALADRFTTTGLKLLFDTGTSDTMTLSDNQNFHTRLMELDVPHTFLLLPGDHSWPYWRIRLPEHLKFHERAFRRAVP